MQGSRLQFDYIINVCGAKLNVKLARLRPVRLMFRLCLFKIFILNRSLSYIGKAFNAWGNFVVLQKLYVYVIMINVETFTFSKFLRVCGRYRRVFFCYKQKKLFQKVLIIKLQIFFSLQTLFVEIFFDYSFFCFLSY